MNIYALTVSELPNTWSPDCAWSTSRTIIKTATVFAPITVVTADGTVLSSMNQMLKNNAESDAIVYAPLQGLAGSVSAEHGIGTEKLDWLASSRSEADLAMMRLLKKSLDPTNLLNPGRVLAP